MNMLIPTDGQEVAALNRCVASEPFTNGGISIFVMNTC